MKLLRLHLFVQQGVTKKEVIEYEILKTVGDIITLQYETPVQKTRRIQKGLIMKPNTDITLLDGMSVHMWCHPDSETEGFEIMHEHLLKMISKERDNLMKRAERCSARLVEIPLNEETYKRMTFEEWNS